MEKHNGEGEYSMWVESGGAWGGGGLCCRDMCYLWVQRSLFAGHSGIYSLFMTASLFRAQHRGDNSKTNPLLNQD